MILVTLGTQKEQFTRLLDYIENSNIKDEIIVQAGHTNYESKKMKIFDFIPYEKMNEYIDKADLVITHAGTGSVLMPLKKNKKVIVCARDMKHDEHVDNHQHELVEVFAGEGYVLELNEETKLDDLVKKMKKFKPKKYVSNTEKFLGNLQNEINEDKNISKKKIFTRKNLTLLGIFTLFCLLFSFIPLTGDDWQNYGNGKFGFINVLRNSYRYYLNWEGRIGSRIIIFLVTYNKWMWNILASLSIMLMVWFSNKLIKGKEKILTISMLFSLIFLMNYEMFVQCFFWIAGHVTYTVCTMLFILYLYYIFNKIEKESKFKIIEIIGLVILNLGMCTFVENIAVGICVSNILFLIYSFFVKKDKNKCYIFTLLASISGLLIQVLSPGTATRMSLEMGEFGKLNLFEKIFYNMGNFVNYTYLINPIMLVVMVLVFDLLIIEKDKNKVRKSLLLAFMNIVPIVTILSSINLILPIEFSFLNNLSNSLSFIGNSDNILIIVYWIIFDIVYFGGIIYYLENSFSKFKLLIIYVCSQTCILSMLVTPTWSSRVAFATVILNYVMVLILLECLKIDYNNVFKKCCYSFCIVYFSLLLLIYYNVDTCVKYRDSYILDEYDEGSREIDYYVVPNKLLWSQYPYSNSYRNAFNGNLGLEEDVQYNEVPAKFKYKIFFEE